jgi:hypothetical protein
MIFYTLSGYYVDESSRKESRVSSEDILHGERIESQVRWS